MTLSARVLSQLAAAAALTLALALVGAANAGSDRHVAPAASITVPLGAGNPCYPVHDYGSGACDKAWKAYVAAKAVRTATAAVAKPSVAAPCAPLHDYKSGRC